MWHAKTDARTQSLHTRMLASFNGCVGDSVCPGLDSEVGGHSECNSCSHLIGFVSRAKRAADRSGQTLQNISTQDKNVRRRTMAPRHRALYIQWSSRTFQTNLSILTAVNKGLSICITLRSLCFVLLIWRHLWCLKQCSHIIIIATVFSEWMK